ncbi:reversion-inducing cysteine-rich protein with Kazal motifs [Coccinella septempunctata]|uniref:reversion-inducing cysteine-rich protein with Kazal motifs n=1 Tax=Coccinella septempunctata TaxID=41139 RepID=UPI001D085A22|nr:reversion-inducing cysteine-rich protein with Kazal motifs [Coccinella septempunctata]
MTIGTRSSAIWIFGFLTVLWYGVAAQDLMCCLHATGSCRNVCEKISLVDLAANGGLRNQTTLEVQKYCSSQLTTFWECLNATFRDISRGENWSGRYCCQVPNSESCRRACITATSPYDLAQGCRQSDEIAFFSCLDRQREGDSCCANARTDDCRDACLDIFRSRLSPSDYQRQRVKDICDTTSPDVSECIKDFVQVTPINPKRLSHCCDMSNKSKCRDTCRRILSTTETTLQTLLDDLEVGGCGPFLLQDFFWQCFFQSPETPSTSLGGSIISRVGIDSAKWHCCQRANNPQCQRLCSKTFSKSWITYWKDFQMKCLNQSSEENLRNCIDEVDEPCELGCDGLSFCTNFNNRPTQLFRSCTTQADDAARNDVRYWQTGNRFSLFGLSLPLKNSTNCTPNLWQTVACTLEIKPCSRHTHSTQICRQDCLDILSQCIDWGEMDLEHTADTICSSISPQDPAASCISLEEFATPLENVPQRLAAQVSSPCKGNPCEANEVCVVNHHCAHGTRCSPYTCELGCKLGNVSEYMVPHGTYVRIPIPNNPRGCLKICKCNKGRIEECQPLLCIPLTHCLLGNTQQVHGSSFEVDCNHCSCYAEEVICSKKQCETSALSGRNTAYTTLPCNCPQHFIPVCGSNGNSYPSACLAKCAMLSDSNIDLLPCQDPCKTQKCPIGYKCVPDPKVCLSLMHKPCTQFMCVNGSTNCKNLPEEPVCDTENRQYPNSCFLAHNNARFAYKGPCLKNCQNSGQVCGINGRTYSSECAAFADMVSVDYLGPCVAVGLITDTKSPSCANVICKELSNPNCLGITPPGACCPICGGSLRLLYSRKQIDRALYALQNESTDSLTLRALLKSLERQIQVVQCTLRGYLTVELDIFVSVQSTEKNPTDIQLEACVREAEKLASLINLQSPRIASELSLSSLTLAKIVHTLDTSGISSTLSRPLSTVLVMLISIVLLHR